MSASAYSIEIRFASIFMLFALLTLSRAQVPGFGKCPSAVKSMQNLTLDSYIGRWYEYSRYPFIFELNTKCAVASYGLLPNGTVSVLNSALKRLSSRPKNVTGTATEDAPGKLTVKFDNMPGLPSAPNYWILGTDYKSYAVVFNCNDIFGILNIQVLWILTRERFPAQATIDTANSIIVENGLSLRPLHKTDQQNCPEDH